MKTIAFARARRSVEEIMTMLLEASEEGTDGSWDSGKIVWTVHYALEGEKENGTSMDQQSQQRMQQHHHHHIEKRKLQARLEIQKDDIQAVLPISKVMYLFLYSLQRADTRRIIVLKAHRRQVEECVWRIALCCLKS